MLPVLHRRVDVGLGLGSLGGPLGWDLAFLAFGVALIVSGLAVARSGERLAGRRR